MTAQFNDIFNYHGVKYAIAGISEGELFAISSLNLRPVMASTACWRGYIAHFAIADSHLTLDALDVRLARDANGERKQGPVINGVKPTERKGEHDMFNNHYKNLHYPVPYTGGVLLGDGFIRELYVHMGFHPAWKYKRVMELIFEAGTLTAEFDRSERVAEIRNELHTASEQDDTNRSPTKKEIEQFVQRAFDRSYSR